MAAVASVLRRSTTGTEATLARAASLSDEPYTPIAARKVGATD